MLKKGLFLILLPLFAFVAAHKFYVSVTNIAYSEKEDALQITCRIFIDDLEDVLRERYDFEAYLATEKESETADKLIEKYLKAKFAVQIDERDVAYDFLGKKYDNDVVICYMEVPKIDLPHKSSIRIRNEVLTDLFEEQQNIVHFRIKGTKKSFVLTKSDANGTLNL
ncbi:DUF6702 family protein [Ulvibacterium sp.]|uniref:DUF6702 family protein n=1 Tax=Ulvibacterium sp. TaxID=2665914 RepID=UPI002614101E|nr:DUF6702 family protein [Ulvibacterium sp.]